ncbi:MAG: PEGA domain-containing protein, partial [bacterium]|nr:PEGA domain-containing protein [bacterium]
VSVQTAETDAGTHTQAGSLKGTVPYMSPEQAHGTADLDRRSDVYALGCLLYEILTLHAAFEGSGAPLLQRVREGDIPAVETRNAKRPPPPPLAELCTRAMALSPAERPATAREFGDALRAWLDGRAERERKHREAEALAAEGKEAARRYRETVAELGEAETAAEAQAAEFKPWQPLSEKRALLDVRRRVEHLGVDVARAFAAATRLLDGALLAEPDNKTAGAALADLWKGRLEDAEREGNRAEVAYAESMVRSYDDGRLAPWLAGEGSLELTSDPPGAEVLLSRFEDQDGVLVATDERSLGVTPVAAVSLPMGSYLCVLKKEGYREVRYPVQITRGRHWQGSVRFLTEAEIGEDFVHVPAGPFVYGEGKNTTTKELADFLIRRT